MVFGVKLPGAARVRHAYRPGSWICRHVRTVYDAQIGAMVDEVRTNVTDGMR